MQTALGVRWGQLRSEQGNSAKRAAKTEGGHLRLWSESADCPSSAAARSSNSALYLVLARGRETMLIRRSQFLWSRKHPAKRMGHRWAVSSRNRRIQLRRMRKRLWKRFSSRSELCESESDLVFGLPPPFAFGAVLPNPPLLQIWPGDAPLQASNTFCTDLGKAEHKTKGTLCGKRLCHGRPRNVGWREV